MQSIYSIPTTVRDELGRNIDAIIQKYRNPIANLDSDITVNEMRIESLMQKLVGNSFDIAAIEGLRKAFGGEA